MKDKEPIPLVTIQMLGAEIHDRLILSSSHARIPRIFHLLVNGLKSITPEMSIMSNSLAIS